jgi:hypothetical protein
MQKVLRIGGAVILSMFLPYITEFLIRQYWWATVTSPGMYIAQREIPVPPRPHELSTLGETILAAFAVDSACYLILILGLSAIGRQLRDKRAKRSRYPQ